VKVSEFNAVAENAISSRHESRTRIRLTSISYISLMPCHGTARWYGRE